MRTRIQFSASLSGASSGSGKDGWFRRMTSREVIASISVSKFSIEESRVRRISAGENKLKTSSVDSGSSQNYKRGDHGPTISIMINQRQGYSK